MNHYGTLSALQPLLRAIDVSMHRCRRRVSDDSLYYLKDGDGKIILLHKKPNTQRQGYTLADILHWLYLTADASISRQAHVLLSQLDDDSFAALEN